MNLLSPGFLLAGLALASIPIIIHILNRRRYREVRWAAMDFLMRAMKKNRKRLRFEQWILLAMRCLLLALLGLALARPLGCAGDRTALGGLARQSGLHVLIVDDSYSMAYEADRPNALTHLDQAKVIGRAVIDRLNPGGDAVAIITASAPAKVLLAPGYDLDAARTILPRIEQSAGATDLAGALRLAVQLGREANTQQIRELDILSDGTRSSLSPGALGATTALTNSSGPAADTAALKDLTRDAAAGPAAAFTHVTYHHLGLANQSHAAVTDLSPASPLLTARQSQDLRATVRGYSDSDLSRTLQWRLDDSILPGGSDVKATESSDPVTLSQVKFNRPGPRVIAASLIGQDRLQIDSIRRRVVDVADHIKVLLVEGERSGAGSLGSSGAFLRLALAPPAPSTDAASPAHSNSPLEPDVISDLDLQNRVLTDYRVVVLAGVPQVPEATAANLKSFVEAGGALVVFVGDAVSAESYNTTLLPKGLLPGALVKRVVAPSDAKGFTFDFNPQGNLHPMLQVFRGETRTGLDTAEVFTYWQTQLTPGAERVLDFAGSGGGAAPAASQPSADPAITTKSLGRGRVVFVATSAGADGWTTLPAKPVFVTLVQEMVSSSLSPRDAWMNLLVGQRLELPAWLKLTGQPVLTDSASKTLTITSETNPATQTPIWRTEPLTRPGVYILTNVADPATSQAASLPVVLNPDSAAEADVRTLPDPALAKALGDAPIEIVHDQLPTDRATEDAGGADFGWPIMLLVLLLLGGESLMALRFGHHGK